MSSENIIVIDGKECAFTPGETLLEVADKNGIDIPTLCYLKRASSTGSCRICGPLFLDSQEGFAYTP
jgi:NADH dehydrogenase/NADH:ubiquinone oxidoreductase subunit G